MFKHVHMLMEVCVSESGLTKCEIEDLRQLHLSWGCNFKAEIHNFLHVQTIYGDEFVKRLHIILSEEIVKQTKIL